MSTRRALVVDDSKTARLVLRRMLEKHKLAVDTAESVGDALDYLSIEHPDVIFMDHMMPGMDGFQALKLIKNNPDTAMIPIMMYTSKGGEMYLGEARALGAVGVLRKEVHPADLLYALQRLHLVDENGVVIPAPAEPPQHEAVAPRIEQVSVIESYPTTDSSAYAELRPLLRHLLEEQREDLKKDMLHSCEAVATLAASGHYHSTAAGRWLNRITPRIEGLGTSVLLLIASLLIMPLLWSWKSDSENGLPLTSGQTNVAAIGLTESPVVDPAELRLREQLETVRADAARDRVVLYESLEWALNDGGEYGFNEVALSEARLDTVHALISNLAAVGFRGTVRLGVHGGQFCLIRNVSGGYELPAEDLTLAECEIRTGSGRRPAIADLQSLAFANFLATSSLVNDGRIQVQVVSHGFSQPRVAYPARVDTQPAGVWNEIAQRNNRLEISIIPAQAGKARSASRQF